MTDASFLRFAPSVCAVEEEYEILIAVKEKGMVLLEIGDEIYHDARAGVCRAEADFFKIRVPQAVLDSARAYTVVFRASQGKQAYWTTFAPHKSERFSFRPVEKTEDIRIYHIADVHYRFETAKATAAYFGEDTDLFVVNGDIGEVETEENYMDVLRFLGEIGEGRVPMVFSRGNHDTRGRLAERFTDYFPAPNGNTYYTFKLGALRGIVLDCGEDKPDKARQYDNTEGVPEKYRGLNRFHEYRRAQTRFLQALVDKNEKFDLVITHICPNMTTMSANDEFRIESDVYAAWTERLHALGVKAMLCGHYHKCFTLLKDDPRNIVPHDYPIVVGSALTETDVIGAALTLFADRMEVKFTSSAHEAVESHTLKI